MNNKVIILDVREIVSKKNSGAVYWRMNMFDLDAHRTVQNVFINPANLNLPKNEKGAECDPVQDFPRAAVVDYGFEARQDGVGYDPRLTFVHGWKKLEVKF